MLRICTRILTNNISNTMATKSKSTLSWAAVCQVNATNNCTRNKDICTNLIHQASDKGAQVIFLPECFDFVPSEKTDSLNLAEALDGPTITHYKSIACERRVWL